VVKYTLGLLLLCTLATGAFHRAKAYRAGDRFDRRNEGWGPLILIRLFGLLTAIAVWRGFQGAVGDGVWNWLGVGIAAGGSALLITMFRALGHNLTDTVETRAGAELVRSGPYRWIRNPMYTGVLVFTAGLGLALGSVSVAISGGAVFAMLAVRTRTEERFLVARFGAQYENYMRDVGRFFPKFTLGAGRVAVKFP